MCELYFKMGALDTSESLPTLQTGSLNVSCIPLGAEEDFLQGGVIIQFFCKVHLGNLRILHLEALQISKCSFQITRAP